MKITEVAAVLAEHGDPFHMNATERRILEKCKAMTTNIEARTAKDDEYPCWICSDCGRKYCKRPQTGEAATFHDGTCDICGKKTAVTEPRDFGRLTPGWRLRATLAKHIKATLDEKPPTL